MKNTKNTKIVLMLWVSITSIIMMLVDGVLNYPYVDKTFLKILLFGIIPIMFLYKSEISYQQVDKEFSENINVNTNNDNDINLTGLFKISKKGLIISNVVGAGIATGIVVAYILVGEVFKLFDFTNITNSLGEVGINRSNFIIVFTYIALCNSFLEEFFFRGVGFLYVKNFIGIKNSYIFSSIFFTIYHLGMVDGWFSPVLFGIVFLGLFVGGLIFNKFNEVYKSIFPSWIVHFWINVGINIVGVILFLKN